MTVIAAGYREIVLTGIHLDYYSHVPLSKLIEKILSLKGNFRLRISSLEPKEVDDRLIELLKNHPKICRHLHLPLQAGTDKILKTMNRPYDVFFISLVNKLRASVPDIAISTDIIVGFLGETKADFIKTYNLAKELDFSKIHVFSYSPRSGTKAANFKNKVPGAEIKERSKKLRSLSSCLEKKFKESFRGQKLKVLVEEKSRGRAQYYFAIPVKSHNLGNFVKIVF